MQGRSFLVLFGAGALAALSLVTGLHATAGGAQALKTRTGIIARAESGMLTLDTEKQGAFAVKLTPATRMLREEAAETADLAVGSLLQVRGRASGSALEARQVVILPATESWHPVKQAKPGQPYGAKAKAADLKLKVTRISPLTAENHYGQSLSVTLASGVKVIRLTPAEAAALQTGLKVQIEYHALEGGPEAKEVLVRLAGSQTQAKQ